MIFRILLQIAAGIFGLWLAWQFVPQVFFNGDIKILVAAGMVLGLVNYFIKPILKLITLPLRILTLGLFGIVINVLLVELVDILFKELSINGIVALLLTTLIVWGLSTVLGGIGKGTSK